MNPEIQLSSIENRLMQAEVPRGLTAWDEFKNFSYVHSCRVTVEDVPELIRVALNWIDDEWFEMWDDANNDESVFEKARHLPIHAWRALAELKVDECAGPLISILNEVAEESDDWCLEELPRVLGLLSPAVIPLLIEFANEADNHVEARVVVDEALVKIADRANNQSVREKVVEIFHGRLLQAIQNPECCESNRDALDSESIRLNSSALMGLLELKAIESAEIIERAFAANQVDTGFAGDWSAVKTTLGVEGKGLEMPDEPINSVIFLRAKMGFGIFSDRRLIVDGDLDGEALEVYYDNAIEQFAASDEGQEVIEQQGSIGWVNSFLSYGIEYLGESVDTMSCEHVEEIVFEIMPRKVSVDADSAHEIMFELRNFWKFVGRVFHCREAGKIVALLDNKATRRLRGALSNPDNFGMAKSMVMMGHEAGFDMTSQQGLNQFMMAYNQSLAQQPVARDPYGLAQPPTQRLSNKADPVTPVMSAAEKKALDKQRKKQLAAKLKKKKKRK